MPREEPTRDGVDARFGIRTRLLAANWVIIAASFVTTTVVAALVGPPMFRRLMEAATRPGGAGDHPYQHAFEKATAISVGTALAVSAVAAVALSWYLSRRVARSAAELAHATTVIADGNYEFRVAPTGLGREVDEIAAAFNTMAGRLGQVERSRRQLLADLAHEMRTPVAIVEAYLEALEDGVKVLDADAVGVLRDQSRRLTRLSTDVAALSDAEHRPDTVDARPVAMAPLVTTVMASLQQRYDAKGVTLESDMQANLPEAWADSERIGQVMTNLLDNALRHTPEGGTVKIAVHATAADTVIAVSDSGDGIPREHLARVFDRFYRVDAARDRGHGGAGIGLAIARALIDGHGGSIEAISGGRGAGSTFTFTLPRLDPTSAQLVGDRGHAAALLPGIRSRRLS